MAEEREGHLAAVGETGCDLYHLCVEMATAQNPPHLPIFRDLGVPEALQVLDFIGSLGRNRTYNLSVKSRMLCHFAAHDRLMEHVSSEAFR